MLIDAQNKTGRSLAARLPLSRRRHSAKDIDHAARIFRARLAGTRALRALRRLEYALKTGFDQNQPRVPAGNPDGGQWVRTGGQGGGTAARADGRIRVAQNRPPRGGGSARRVGGARGDATPAQEARLAASEVQAQAAITRVRKVDPAWKPTPGLFETAEGEITHNEAVVREAEARLMQLGRRSPTPRAVRDIVMPDGNLVGSRNRGAGPGVQTVTRRQFRGMLDQLMVGAEPEPTPPGYKGQYYRRTDGTIFGVRMSRRYGVTIDIVDHPLGLAFEKLKVHQK